MAERPTTKKKAPAKKGGKKKAAAPRNRKVTELVEQVLGNIESKIAQNELKPTVGDYLRLLQFREEIEQNEQPKEIKVTWVESPETKSGK